MGKLTLKMSPRWHLYKPTKTSSICSGKTKRFCWCVYPWLDMRRHMNLTTICQGMTSSNHGHVLLTIGIPHLPCHYYNSVCWGAYYNSWQGSSHTEAITHSIGLLILSMYLHSWKCKIIHNLQNLFMGLSIMFDIQLEYVDKSPLLELVIYSPLCWLSST